MAPMSKNSRAVIWLLAGFALVFLNYAILNTLDPAISAEYDLAVTLIAVALTLTFAGCIIMGLIYTFGSIIQQTSSAEADAELESYRAVWRRTPLPLRILFVYLVVMVLWLLYPRTLDVGQLLQEGMLITVVAGLIALVSWMWTRK